MVKNLKLLRSQKGISQQQLGDIIGFSQQSIHKYETQLIEPDINTLIKLADYFNTTVDYLIGFEAKKSTEKNDLSPFLTPEESQLIENYRSLSSREKESIAMIIENYLKKY